jgi:hypothetical protein
MISYNSCKFFISWLWRTALIGAGVGFVLGFILAILKIDHAISSAIIQLASALLSPLLGIDLTLKAYGFDKYFEEKK